MNLTEIYRFAFPDGEKVVLIDDEDRVYWGRLKTTYSHAVITRSGQKDFVDWDRVSFMAQDEFNFRKVKGPYPAIENLLDSVRAVIVEELKREAWNRGFRRRRIRRSDPFEMEGLVSLHNAGNDGPDYWGEDDAEALVIEQPGRIGMVWDLGTIHEYGT